MLKIFSIINYGKTITLSHSNLSSAIDSYLEKLVEKVSTQNHRRNVYLEKSIRESIYKFSYRLWNDNTRRVNYPTDFIKIFDPNYDGKSNLEQTNSYKVLDEGIFISRKMHEKDEYVEFTYDLLGGFCIAKAVFFQNQDSEEIIKKLKSEEVTNKLFNVSEHNQLHPLFEDIISSIIFLLPSYAKKEIFEILDNEIVAKYSISMLDLIAASESGRTSFLKYMGTLKADGYLMKTLLDKIISEVINYGSCEKVDILVSCLLRMNSTEIDVSWSEQVRKNAKKIIQYLDNFIEKHDCDNLLCENAQNVFNQICFFALLLTTTNRPLRDRATKCLSQLGNRYPSELFKVFRLFEGISDLYVIDRLLATLCGVVLLINDEKITLEIADYVENAFFVDIRTTHILILDYVDTIISFAEFKYGYVRQTKDIDRKLLEKWEKDKKCLENVRGDATWGYGPVNMDFSKYVIGHLASDYYSDADKSPKLRDCLAMVIWRMKKLGYSEDVFGELDKEITQNERNNRFDNSNSTERYGKKYSWIAFYELYGYFILKKILKSDDGYKFRISSVDIDPTFPKKPQKEQLVTECFLPKYDESVQQWIIQERNCYLAGLYTTKLYGSQDEWVLLRGHISQKDEKDSKIDVFVNTFITSKLYKNSLAKYLTDNERGVHYSTPQFYYLFAGEIAWSNNISCEDESLKLGQKRIKVLYPYSWYSWESYHSQMNNAGGVPFLSKQIAQSLKLYYNVKDLSFYSQDGQQCTKYLWDDYSHFLYIKKDLLIKFLEDNNFGLVWYEIGTRYGEFGKHETKLNPSFLDFKHAEILIL